MTLPSFFSAPDKQNVLRGHPPLTPSQAHDHAALFQTPCFSLLGAPIPYPLRYRGMTLQGAQGTGKTLTILRLLLEPLARLSAPGNFEKVIVIDAKGDLTSALLGMTRVVCPGVPIYFLNPFERFATAIDPYEFANEPTRITQLVQALTYRDRDARTDDFFDSSARAHLVDLVKILQRRVPGRWTWRQLLLIATSFDLFERVLKASKIGRRKAGTIVKKTFAGVVATIQSWLDQYESTFACWERSAVFRLNAFLRAYGIVILTLPEDQVDSLAPIARLLLRGVKDRLLADTGRNPASRTTIVLDEFADLKDCVPTLMPFFGRARSANVSLLCAWQSWPAVCDAHGEQRMKGVVDNAAVRVWFGCGAESSEVAAKDCMNAEVRRGEWSYTYARENSSTLSYRTELRSNVLPAEIQALRPPTPADLTVRAFLTASYLPGPLFCQEDYRSMVEFLRSLPHVPAMRPRSPSDHWLDPWDDIEDGAALEALFRREQ